MFGRKSRSFSIGQKEFLEKAKEKGAHIIDVRSEQEFKEGCLSNAENIPMNRLAIHLDEIKKYVDKKEPVLLYCLSGARSKMACRFLEKQGLTEGIYDLQGGIHQWSGPLK